MYTYRRKIEHQKVFASFSYAVLFAISTNYFRKTFVIAMHHQVSESLICWIGLPYLHARIYGLSETQIQKNKSITRILGEFFLGNDSF